MNQSSFIAGSLLAGFVLYLAAKGRLSVYANVLWGPTSQPVPSGGSSSGKSSVVNPLVSGAVGTAASAILGPLGGSLTDAASGLVDGLAGFLGG